MEKLIIEKDAKPEPRPVAIYDLEGELDTMFLDEKGMKVAHVLGGKGGIVIGTYDKDNEMTEAFLSAALLFSTFAKVPDEVKADSKQEDRAQAAKTKVKAEKAEAEEKKAEAEEEKAKKAEEEKARAKLQTEAEKEKADDDTDEPTKRSHHKKVDK